MFARGIFTTLFILIASSALHAARPGDFHPVSHEGYDVKDNKIYFRYGNTGMIIEMATDQSIADYYRERGIDIGNPFQAMAGTENAPYIFIITFLNRGKSTISFTPSYTLVKVKDETFFPMDFGELWNFISNLDPGIQKVMQKSIYHSPESIRAGEITTKLLIFPVIERKMTKFTLEFDFLYMENHEFRPVFYFEAPDKKK